MQETKDKLTYVAVAVAVAAAQNSSETSNRVHTKGVLSYLPQLQIEGNQFP
jgi:hypothetical protein